MVSNYVIVADFCDRAGPFFKFEKNCHITARNLWFRFCLKTDGFRFEDCNSTRNVLLLLKPGCFSHILLVCTVVLYGIYHAVLLMISVQRQGSIRRIWNLPCQAHGYLLSLLTGCLPVYNNLRSRFMNFVHSCTAHRRTLVSTIARYSIIYGRHEHTNSSYLNSSLYCQQTYFLFLTCLIWWQTLITSRMRRGASSILEAKLTQAIATTCRSSKRETVTDADKCSAEQPCKSIMTQFTSVAFKNATYSLFTTFLILTMLLPIYIQNYGSANRQPVPTSHAYHYQTLIMCFIIMCKLKLHCILCLFEYTFHFST